MQHIIIFFTLLASINFNCFGFDSADRGLISRGNDENWRKEVLERQTREFEALRTTTDVAKNDLFQFLKTCNQFEPLDTLDAQEIDHMKKVMAQPQTKAIVAPYMRIAGPSKNLNPYTTYNEQAFLYAASMGLLDETQNIRNDINVLLKLKDKTSLAEIARNLAYTRQCFLNGLSFSELENNREVYRKKLLDNCAQLTGNLHHMVLLEDSLGKLTKMPRGVVSLITIYAIDDTDYSEFSSNDSCSIQ